MLKETFKGAGNHLFEATIGFPSAAVRYLLLCQKADTPFTLREKNVFHVATFEHDLTVTEFHRSRNSIVYDYMVLNDKIPPIFETIFNPSDYRRGGILLPQPQFQKDFVDTLNLLKVPIEQIYERHCEFMASLETFNISKTDYEIRLRSAIKTIFYPIYNIQTGIFMSGYPWANSISLETMYLRPINNITRRMGVSW